MNYQTKKTQTIQIVNNHKIVVVHQTPHRILQTKIHPNQKIYKIVVVHQTPHRIFQTKMHPNQKIYKIVVHQTPHKILQTRIHPNQKLRIKPKVLHK